MAGVEENREYFQLTIVAPLVLLLEGGCYQEKRRILNKSLYAKAE